MPRNDVIGKQPKNGFRVGEWVTAYFHADSDTPAGVAKIIDRRRYADITTDKQDTEYQLSLCWGYTYPSEIWEGIYLRGYNTFRESYCIKYKGPNQICL